MTRTSQRGMRAPAGFGTECRVNAGSRPWHVLCTLLGLAGCLYIEPAWSPDMNLPPEILSPDPDQEHVLDLNQFSQVMVTARETDGDELIFIWRAPDAANAEVIDLPQDEDVWASVLRIADPAASLDGQSITCTIVDEASPANRIEISWTILLEAL